MSNKPIIQTPLVSNPTDKIEFTPKSFNSGVQNHGLKVWIDKAIRCPCLDKATGSAQSDCSNCGGTSWVFVNRFESRAILQSINSNTKYTDWTEQNLGTVSVTARNIDRLSFMDRITIIDARAIFNEILRPSQFQSEFKAITIYEPVEILELWLFNDSNEPLIKLDETQYSFLKNVLTIDYSVTKLIQAQEVSISVKYEHQPMYHIIDINRDIMLIEKRAKCNDTDSESMQNLPVLAIGRRAHYVLDAPDFNEGLIDNSYSI